MAASKNELNEVCFISYIEINAYKVSGLIKNWKALVCAKLASKLKELRQNGPT